MLTGILPIDDPSPTNVAVQQITLSPPPPRQINPNLNEQVEAVLLKILSKSPGERYHSGSEFMAALKDALEAAPISTAGKIELPPQPPGLPPPHVSLVRTYSQVSIAQTVQKNLDARSAQAPPEPTLHVNPPSSDPASPQPLRKYWRTSIAPAPEDHPVEPTQVTPIPWTLPARRHTRKAGTIQAHYPGGRLDHRVSVGCHCRGIRLINSFSKPDGWLGSREPANPGQPVHLFTSSHFYRG